MGPAVEQVTAIGQDNNDLAKLYDGPNDDSLLAGPGSAKINYNGSPTNFVEALGFRYTHSYATSTGNDTAELHDSAATNDTFVGLPEASRLYGSTFYNRAAGFETIIGHASGLDTAKLYDSPGDDTYSCGPDFADMQYDGGSLVQTHDFPYAFGFAFAGGNDTANMQDAAATADRLKCKVNYGKLYGPGFFTKAIDFEKLTATATPGQPDIAQLYDRAGDDMLEGTPTATKLKFDGLATTFVEAVDFRYTHGFATSGGDDTATLQDAAATAETFEGNSNEGKLYNSGFYVRAKYFDQVTATATPGQPDVATLYDAAGSDIFNASPTTAKMSYDGSATHFTQADGFRYVHGLAYAVDTPGAVDKAYLTDSAGDDLLQAYPDYSKLYNNTVGFYSRARLFDEVHATGGGLTQDDYAYLYPKFHTWDEKLLF